jgi:PAS domain S-box-containing protein
VKVNDAAVSQYGYSKEEFLDMKLIDIHPPTTVPDLVERCALPGKDCKLDPVRAGHSKHRRKDGTFIDVDIVCYPIPFEGRETIFMLLTDIQQRAREKQFV